MDDRVDRDDPLPAAAKPAEAVGSVASRRFLFDVPDGTTFTSAPSAALVWMASSGMTGAAAVAVALDNARSAAASASSTVCVTVSAAAPVFGPGPRLVRFAVASSPHAPGSVLGRAVCAAPNCAALAAMLAVCAL